MPTLKPTLPDATRLHDYPTDLANCLAFFYALCTQPWEVSYPRSSAAVHTAPVISAMQEMVTYFVGLARENNNTFPAGKYEAYSIYNYAPVYTARVDPDNASCTTLTTHLKLSSLALYIHTHTHAHPGNNLTIGLFVRYTKRVDTLASLSTTSPTTVLDQTCIATHFLLSLTLPCLPSFFSPTCIAAHSLLSTTLPPLLSLLPCLPSSSPVCQGSRHIFSRAQTRAQCSLLCLNQTPSSAKSCATFSRSPTFASLVLLLLTANASQSVYTRCLSRCVG